MTKRTDWIHQVCRNMPGVYSVFHRLMDWLSSTILCTQKVKICFRNVLEELHSHIYIQKYPKISDLSQGECTPSSSCVVFPVQLWDRVLSDVQDFSYKQFYQLWLHDGYVPCCSELCLSTNQPWLWHTAKSCSLLVLEGQAPDETKQFGQLYHWMIKATFYFLFSLFHFSFLYLNKCSRKEGCVFCSTDLFLWTHFCMPGYFRSVSRQLILMV